MDGEFGVHLTEILFIQENASSRRLALLLLNGGDRGISIYISPKILPILRQRRALEVVFSPNLENEDLRCTNTIYFTKPFTAILRLF